VILKPLPFRGGVGERPNNFQGRGWGEAKQLSGEGLGRGQFSKEAKRII